MDSKEEDFIDVSSDFDITFISQEEMDEKQQVEEKLAAVLELIDGFITKLKSNPTADTIKWPSRIKDIERFEGQLKKAIK